jgi:uncharacterized protein YecA (UPF0149 family)
MDLDRGVLAKIDRRVFSGLGREEAWQMVRVPVSEAVWSTWRRYCVAIGISMGGAISALVEQELRTVIDQEGEQPVFLAEVEDRLSEREAALDKRERVLGERERWLRESERRIRGTPEPRLIPADVAKVGRNDRCPCGSGLKYKRCHGL